MITSRSTNIDIELENIPVPFESRKQRFIDFLKDLHEKLARKEVGPIENTHYSALGGRFIEELEIIANNLQSPDLNEFYSGLSTQDSTRIETYKKIFRSHTIGLSPEAKELLAYYFTKAGETGIQALLGLELIDIEHFAKHFGVSIFTLLDNNVGNSYQNITIEIWDLRNHVIQTIQIENPGIELATGEEVAIAERQRVRDLPPGNQTVAAGAAEAAAAAVNQDNLTEFREVNGESPTHTKITKGTLADIMTAFIGANFFSQAIFVAGVAGSGLFVIYAFKSGFDMYFVTSSIKAAATEAHHTADIAIKGNTEVTKILTNNQTLEIKNTEAKINLELAKVNLEVAKAETVSPNIKYGCDTAKAILTDTKAICLAGYYSLKTALPYIIKHIPK